MTDHKRASRALVPFRVLGWIAGALSVVNLTRDLNWFTLRGNIAQWVNTYQRLVADVRSLLFGWLHVLWIQVSQLEAHGLVLALLVVSSFIRGFNTADNPADRTSSRDDLVGDLMGTMLVGWAFPVFTDLLIALALPDPWGLWTMLTFTLLFIGYVARNIWLYDREVASSSAESTEYVQVRMSQTFWRSFALNLTCVAGFALVVVLLGTII